MTPNKRRCHYYSSRKQRIAKLSRDPPVKTTLLQISTQRAKRQKNNNAKMEKFDVSSLWKPPRKDFLLTIHRIQWPKWSCCAPLRLLVSEPTINNGQKAISEVSTTSKKFVSLYKLLLRLYISTNAT